MFSYGLQQLVSPCLARLNCLISVILATFLASLNFSSSDYCSNALMPPIPFDPPLPWIWSCHQCRTRYPLGATRRCLNDGHYFCGGTTVSEISGKLIKQHKACGSEFDYGGWKDMAAWRKSLRRTEPNEDFEDEWEGGEVVEDIPSAKKETSCEATCFYPSDCRHDRKRVAERIVAKQMRDLARRRQRSLGLSCRKMSPSLEPPLSPPSQSASIVFSRTDRTTQPLASRSEVKAERTARDTRPATCESHPGDIIPSPATANRHSLDSTSDTSRYVRRFPRVRKSKARSELPQTPKLWPGLPAREPSTSPPSQSIGVPESSPSESKSSFASSLESEDDLFLDDSETPTINHAAEASCSQSLQNPTTHQQHQRFAQPAS